MQCVVANIDADAAKNKPLAEKYGVGSFPTIKFFPKDNKGLSTSHDALYHSSHRLLDEPLDYDGERTEEAFVEFLNQHCGTHRAAGGLLDDTVGRHPEFDSMASRFVAANGATRDKLYSDAELLSGAFGTKYKYYLRVMEKVLNGSEDYIEKESNR